MSPLAHEEIQELLGAYALDAVDPDEAEAIERHLETCPRCRAEVEGHREVASMLGNSGGDAPDGLWDRIASQLEDAPPPMRLEVQDGPPRSPRWRPAGASGAAGSSPPPSARPPRWRSRCSARRWCASSSGSTTWSPPLEETTLQAAANRAFDDPDAVKVQLQSADGEMTARAVVLPDGSGFLMAHELPALDADRTYQLWGDTGAGSLVSLGLLGDDPAIIAFQAGTDLDALAITEEEAGGVVQSRNPAVIAGTFD